MLALAGCGGGDEPRGQRTATATRTLTTAREPRPEPLRFRECRDVAGFRCATLTVPLRRRAGEGRTLKLAVAVQAGRDDAPRGDLVALSGGPGQPGLPFGPRVVQRLGDALDGYRVVVLDQRGTGGRALRCPALQRAVGTSDLTVPPARAVRACADEIGERRDAFATAETVADLEALRAALGARRLTLLGVSYGTFVAERYALAHPGRTRGLLLDSVVPQLGAELLERVPLRATARVLRATCDAEPARCAGGDPVRDLETLLRRSPALGPPLFDTLTALSIGEPRLDEALPALRAAAAGDLAPLRGLIEVVADAQQAPAQALSQGLHAATLCADSPAPWADGPAAPRERRRAALAALRRTLPARATAPFPPATATRQGLVRTCELWPQTPPPPPLPRGARIAAPALLLAGDRDLSTPLEWARAQAAAMRDARLVVIPGAGHSVISREPGDRGRRAAEEFLSRLR